MRRGVAVGERFPDGAAPVRPGAGVDLAQRGASVTLDGAEDRWLSRAHGVHSLGEPIEVLRKQVPAQV